MDEHEDDQLDPLLDELRSLFKRHDPVPPLVTRSATAALGWRRLDADLAELLADSALDADALALARGDVATLRSVTFSAGALTIDIEIQLQGAARTLLGKLSPAARTKIELQSSGEATPIGTESDRLGRFRIKLPAASSIRLRVAVGNADAANWIETSWIPL